MPQERRRAISYSSFVTCDNPKGVECGAIRKTRSISSEKKEQHNNKVECEKKQENQTPSLTIIKQEKRQMGITGFTRELVDTSPSIQLHQVTKGGADSLNHVTNSWSNNVHKQDIAKDLLKGFLDLQESLVILSKLQETLSYKSKRKHKQKQKLEELMFDNMGNWRMYSDRFGYIYDEKKLHMGLQGPRISVDGSLRKSVDEVKSVVRESLLRQNVVKNPTFEHFHHRKLDSTAMPSTSSSSFSLFDSSVSSIVSQRRKKGKGSNLIGKLMGLDSFPSSPKAYIGREKVPNSTKPMYDIESPRARKPNFGTQELGTTQKSFDEILESLNFKGLLRSDSGKRLPPNPCNFEDFTSVDERPPIVVMRPVRFWEDGDLVNEGNLLKPSSRRGSPQPTVGYYETANLADKFREVTAGESLKKKWVLPKKVAYDEEKSYFNLHEEPLKKKGAVRRLGEDERVTYIRRKGEDNIDVEHFDEYFGTWDLGKLTRSKMEKQKYGDFFSNNQNSYEENTRSSTLLDYRNVKNSASLNHWKKKRQPVSMVEMQRSRSIRKENEATAGDEIDSFSENEYVFQTFDSMLVNKLNLERWNKQYRTIISDYDTESQSSVYETLEDTEYLNSNNKNSLCDTTVIGHPDENHSQLSEVTSTSISEHCNVGGPHDENQSPLSVVTSITGHEIGIAVHLDTNEEGNVDPLTSFQPDEDVIQGDTDNEPSAECLTPRAKMKGVLLSSQLFVDRAEELFNLQVNPGSIPPHVTDESHLDVANSKVLQDCAVELMEQRSSKLSQVCLPSFWTTYPRNTSMSQLLEEICTVIEDLRCYHNSATESSSSDQLHTFLDHDLRFNTGIWEFGWRNACSLDEVEQIVGEVDKFVLGNLIEEVVADFLL